MNKYFNLSNTLSRNSNGDPKDTLKVKQTLHKLGYMEEPSYGIDDMPDKPLFDGIKDFQIDKGLKADGVMKPGGETEDALNKVFKGEKPKPKKPVSKKEAEPIISDKIIDFPNKKDKPKLDHPIIKKSVGIGKVNNPEDVQMISEYLDEILGKKGEDKPSPINANSDFLFDIQKFQKENGLKIDGVINPDGETSNSLSSQSKKEKLDLPVVMPGPVQPEPEDMSQECLDLNTDLEAANIRIEELSENILNWTEQANMTTGEIQEMDWATSEVIGVAGGAGAILSGIVAIGATGAAAAASAAITPLLGVLAVIEGAKIIYNKLYTLNERIADAEKEKLRLSIEAQRLDGLLDGKGCPRQ